MKKTVLIKPLGSLSGLKEYFITHPVFMRFLIEHCRTSAPFWSPPSCFFHTVGFAILYYRYADTCTSYPSWCIGDKFATDVARSASDYGAYKLIRFGSSTLPRSFKLDFSASFIQFNISKSLVPHFLRKEWHRFQAQKICTIQYEFLPCRASFTTYHFLARARY